MDYPSREQFLVLKKAIYSEISTNSSKDLWGRIGLWAWSIPKPYCEYRNLFGVRDVDGGLFTPIFEIYGEWEGEVLAIKSYRYHSHPKMDPLDPHNPFVVIEIDMEDIWS